MSAGKVALIMRREGNSLVPADPWTAEKLDMMPEGVDLTAAITRTRVIKTNNVYWAGLSHAVHEIFEGEKAERYPTSKKLHKALMLSLGYCEAIYRIDGSVLLVEDSTSFDAMDEDDFRLYFERAKAQFWVWMERDPWDEWMKSRPPLPGKR